MEDHLEIAAPAQLAGDILRNILGPVLGRIEGDDADRAAILAGEEILDNCFEVRQARPICPKSSATR
jgi:hypothetical protein